MQQIYRRTLVLKCDFNKAVLQLYWNRTSAWVFSCKFAAYFQNTFFKNTSEWLLLILWNKVWELLSQPDKIFSIIKSYVLFWLTRVLYWFSGTFLVTSLRKDVFKRLFEKGTHRQTNFAGWEVGEIPFFSLTPALWCLQLLIESLASMLKLIYKTLKVMDEILTQYLRNKHYINGTTKYSFWSSSCVCASLYMGTYWIGFNILVSFQ